MAARPLQAAGVPVGNVVVIRGECEALMNTDLNGKIQGKLNQNRKNRNTKKALLVLSLAAVIFTSTVLANPASALTEDVSGEVVQGLENNSDAQAADEQANAQGNEAAPSSDPQETLAAPSADQGVMNANSVSAVDSAAVTENGTEDSGIAVSGAEADGTKKSADQISAAEGTGTAEQGATLAEAAETVSTEEAAADKTTEKTEQAAQSETDVLSFADDRAQVKIARKDGTGFPSDTTMSGSPLGTDDWNRVLSAVSSKVKAQSDDSTAYSVAGLHTWTLSLQAGDGSAASYDDIRAEAEFQGGLNDAGYATKTSEKEESGTDGTSTTTASYETSWRVYAISGDSVADPVKDYLTDLTDADGTSLSVDENGALQSAAFDGSLPETVVFAQIVRETVTTGTEKKEEIPMPAVTFDREATTDHGTIAVHVEADEGTFEQGTTMSVKRVSSQDILDKAIEAAGGRGSAAAVDISFRKADGTETEPAKPIRVKMTAKVLGQADKAHVVHVDDNGSTVVVAKKSDGKTIESTSGKAASSDAKNAVSFESDSFSVYAIVYTVDFEYSVNGKMYQFSLHGGEKIALSDLIEVLGIIGDTNNGEKAAFNSVDSFLKEVANVEFSDESLVKVTPVEGDWELESLQPFSTDEDLTITMKNGDVVTVKVTDDQETTSTNLSDFLTNASIAAPLDSDGKYLITPDASYDIALTFTENKGLQFDNNAAMTYDLSQSGLDFSGLAQNGKFSIKVNDGGTFYTLSNNTFSIDENGQMTLHFDTSDPHFSNLMASNNTRFTINLDAKVNSDANKIVFKDGIEKDVKIDTSNSVSASKSATFNKQTGKVDYTVAVVSHGVSKNVVVKDTITGDALTLDASSIHASSSTGQSVSMTGGASGNSFEYTIGSMKNGEIVTFTYSADIDMSQIHNVNGKYISTGNNRVEVKSDGDPEPDVVNRTTTIDYTPTVNKSNGEIVKDNGETKTLSWTITANEDCKVSMAGGTITDTIGSASQSIMKYSGTGIKVDVYDASGTKVREDNKLWDDLTNKTDSTWTYTIPVKDQGKAYKYVISYTTDVNVKGNNASVNVDNKVVTDGGNVSTGSSDVPPAAGNEITCEKKVSKVDVPNREVTWNIVFTVPETGLSKAVVKDYYPKRGDQTVFEKVINGSVHASGLIDGESFNVDYDQLEGDQWNGRYYALITFFQDANKTTPGLKSGSARTIVVTLKTELDDDWLKDSSKPNMAWLMDHKNSADFELGTYTDSKSDVAKATLPSIEKDGKFEGNRIVDGVELPIYKYTIKMTGVSSSDNTIIDTFDTNLLEVYNNKDDAFFTYCGNQYETWLKSTGPASYISTPAGIEIHTDSSSVEKDENGEFRKRYDLVYYLTVKDEAALKTIMSRAIANDNGKYTMSNTADWNGITDGADVTYEYVGLDKEILTSEDELKKSDEDIWADFRITLNPGGMMLNGGEPLNVTDTITNLSIDYNSIVATPSEGVTWDQTDSVTTFTIPDETKVVITYRARVLFKTIGENGSTIIVGFRNVAQMDGYRDEISGSGERHNSGGGVASVPVINLLKYRAGSMNEPLSGAVFALLDKDKNPVTWGKAYGDHKVGDPVQFTTGSDGKIHVRGDQANYGWALDEDTRYYLREITAPEGYMLADFDYSFKISSDGTTDYSDPEWKYHTGDTMSAKNYPGTDVQVNKVWSDGNDKHSTDTVTVKLQQRLQTGTDSETGEATWGSWSDKIRMEDSSDHYVWKDFTSKTITLKEDSGWSGTFTGLPLVVPSSLTEASEDVEVQYQVVETLVNDEAPEVGTVTIGQSKNGGAYVFTVNNTVKETTGSLKIHKEVTYNGHAPTNDTQKSVLAGTYTFTIFTDEACTTPYQEVAGTNKTVSVTIGNDGVAKDSETVTLPVGTYWLREETPENGTTPVANKVKVDVSETNTTDSPAVVNFKNNKDVDDNPDDIIIEIEKKFTGLDSASEIPAGFKAVLTYQSGSQTVTTELKNETVGNVTWYDNGLTWLWKIKNIPNNATNFTLKEESYNKAGYTLVAKINGSVVSNPSDPVSVTAIAPSITMTSYDDYTTPDGFKEFNVPEGSILLVRLTGSGGTLVVSHKPLSLATRTAIENKIETGEGLQAQWKTPVTFFSQEMHPEGFTFKGTTINFVGDKVRIAHNQSSHEDQYTVAYTTSSAANSFTLENDYTEIPITVDVVKVDKTTPSKKLPGAKFTVRKLDENDGVPVPLSSGEFSGTEVTGSPIITSAQGEASIGNLTHGYYELREKEAPNGYVLTSTSSQYFKIEGDIVTWIEWSATENKWIDKNTDEMVTFTAAQAAVVDDPETTEIDESKDATNATFEVKNEPGVALPSTGGPGTRFFTLLGSMLICLAGAGFILLNKKREG